MLLNILGGLRVKMAKNAGVGKDWFGSLLSAGLLDFIKAKDVSKVKEIVRKITGEEIEIDFS